MPRAPYGLALALAVAIAATPSNACGPDFRPTLLDNREASLATLPDGSFTQEIRRLAGTATGVMPVVEDGWSEPADTRDKIEREGLSPTQISALEAAREQASPSAAYAAAEGLSESERLYLGGAAAYDGGDWPTANEWFVRANAEPGSRQLWALYMLGQIAGEAPDAAQHYAALRQRVSAGAADPLGLAVASLGEQARTALNLGKPADALRLYLQQASYGSTAAVTSIRLVLRRILADNSTDLSALMQDPTIAPVVASYLFNYVYELSQSYQQDGWRDEQTEQEGPALNRVFAALKSLDGPIAGADRYAAAAYRAGHIALATTLLNHADGPLADWVAAKLALQRGDLPAATAAYARAAKGFPADEAWGDSEYDLGLKPACRVSAEQGIVVLSQGDFREAFELFFAAGDPYWTDTAYLAERVLTLDELQSFVDTRTTVETDRGEYGELPIGMRLRDLLARRLVRSDRVDAAAAYFAEPATREHALAYGKARAQAAKASGVDRAEALFNSATLMRKHGMEIAGFEGDPDYAEHGGMFDINAMYSYGDEPVAARTDVALSQPSHPDEIVRRAASIAQPLARYHYRVVAHDLAIQAADALPPRSQAFAMALCTAGSYVINRHPDLGRATYARYVREGAFIPFGYSFARDCATPNFDGARAMLRAEQTKQIKRWVRKAALPTGVLLLGLFAGAVWWWRRRTRKA